MLFSEILNEFHKAIKILHKRKHVISYIIKRIGNQVSYCDVIGQLQLMTSFQNMKHLPRWLSMLQQLRRQRCVAIEYSPSLPSYVKNTSLSRTFEEFVSQSQKLHSSDSKAKVLRLYKIPFKTMLIYARYRRCT